MTIDGYTQPGASANTLAEGNDAVLLIELNGANAGTNVSGLEIRASNSTIEGLVINRFSAHGVIIRTSGATGNKVEGNFIGTNANGTEALGNTGGGVIIDSVPGNTVGGTASGARNVISANGDDGVQISGSGATGNRVLSNSIFSNTAGLGIDLSPNDGVTANDDKDPDAGANNLQNFPVLTRARTPRRGGTVIRGIPNSTPGTTFTVQFFSNFPGEDEGRTLLTQFTNITTDANGNAPISFRSSRLPRGFTVTATVTDPAGNTSEFSNAVRVVQKKKRRR